MTSEDSWLKECFKAICRAEEVPAKEAVVSKQLVAQQSVQQQQLLERQFEEQQRELCQESCDEKQIDDPVNEQSLKIGRIQFSVKYNFDTNTLLLGVLQATNLAAKDLGGTSDPYVKVTLLPETAESLCTEVRHKNCHPRWNETFQFEEYPYQVLKEMVLFLQVFDFDRFSKDDPIGEVRLPLCGFDLVQGQKLWKNLCYSQDKKCGLLGDLLLELSYDCPVLKVGVLKAKNLRPLDVNGTSDPYVKVWLLHDCQRQAKKKTAVKSNTLNPIFNEVIEFHVSIDKIRHVSLEVSVMDYDKFGRNEAIGKIVLGSKTCPGQVRHWNEMFQCPRKPVAKWHSLRAYE